jgi:hypothetical protein
MRTQAYPEGVSFTIDCKRPASDTQGGLLARRTARFTNNQFGGHGRRGRVFAGNPPQQKVDHDLGPAPDILPHRRQRGIRVRRQRDVAKADDRDVTRHIPPCAGQGTDRTDCDDVSSREYCIKGFSGTDVRPHRLVSGVGRQVRWHDLGGPDPGCVLEGSSVAFIPQADTGGFGP